MGCGRNDQKRKPSVAKPRAAVSVHPELTAVLPTETVRTWKALVPLLPTELYLGGGTAVAVHLGHRESYDLDFFYHGDAVDLEALAKKLGRTGQFAVTHEGEGTLRGLFGGTKLEFFHADEVRPLQLLEEPQTVAGLRVAGLKDLMAMKLKVLAERGELRDYYDVKLIEERGKLTVEDGIALFLERYALRPESEQLQHLVRALGYLDDTEEDEALPTSKSQLATWWRQRQARLLRHLGRNPVQ